MRVLLVGDSSFSKTENCGKTLCSFFANFDAKDLAQLYFGVCEAPHQEFCNNYYRVTVLDNLKAIFNGKSATTNTHEELIASIKNYKFSKVPWYYRKLFRWKIVRESVWRTKKWDSPDLRQWIENFKPDVIFATIGSNLYVHKIAIRLSERYNIPMFIYFTDDYYVDSAKKGLKHIIRRHLLRKQYKETIAKAHTAYAIGEKMQKTYSKIFSRSFGILGNAIDVEKYTHISPKKIEKGETLVISYMGSLHSNRWKMIAAFGNFIKEVNRRLDDYKVCIKVFSSSGLKTEISKAFAESEVEFCGVLDTEGVIRQMDNSHFLLHVESFDEVSRAFVRYSVSTKISEYLSSSRMLLAYGPHDVASMELLIDNNLGCCSTDLDSEETIVNKICAAIENYNNYDYTSSKQFVLDNYTKEIMTSRLANDLSKAVER